MDASPMIIRKHVMPLFLVWFLLTMVAAPVCLHACRYNVRDVGFVSLETVSYRLYGYVGAGTSGDAMSAWRTVGTTSFLDSNIECELIDPEASPDHRGLRYQQEPPTADRPTFSLVSPDGQFLPLELPKALSGTDKAVAALMESVVRSPLRDRLQTEVVRSYAVVVLIEGADPQSQAKARTEVDEAVRDIASVMDRFPKPVRMPPQVIEIPRSALAAEKVLLWSLGIGESMPEEPVAAVVYGRGRRLGPLLEGEAITRTQLSTMLGLLGQDCECDLDRSWMQGPLVPMSWGMEQQAEVLKEVGFDAENPMVKTEISRILARGPSSGARRLALPGIDSGGLIGYKEMAIESSTSGEGDSPAPSTDSIKLAAVDAPALEAGGARVAAQIPELEKSAFPVLGYVAIGLVVFMFGGGAMVVLRRR
jgi:hypothetical protein